MIDDGCTVEGYQSDITRTFVLGKANRQDEEGVRHRPPGAGGGAQGGRAPGVPLEAIDAGRPQDRRRQRLRTRVSNTSPTVSATAWAWTATSGPTLVKKQHVRVGESADPCSRGMVFSDEPGVYIKGEFGVRLEDDMHVTENGAELFTPQSPSIEDPFGA